MRLSNSIIIAIPDIVIAIDGDTYRPPKIAAIMAAEPTATRQNASLSSVGQRPDMRFMADSPRKKIRDSIIRQTIFMAM
jgi:hypothetical protein